MSIPPTKPPTAHQLTWLLSKLNPFLKTKFDESEAYILPMFAWVHFYFLDLNKSAHTMLE
jgi:hypothetical protein